MGRALAKRHLKVIGVDDGSFTRRHRFAPLVAVAVTVPGLVEGILTTRVRVDGTDATDRLIGLLKDSPHLDGCRAILLDGVTVGGFNPLDLDRLAERLRRPVVSVTRHAPEFPAIRSALAKYFPRDARRRFAVLTRRRPFRLATAGNPIWIAVAGARRGEATALVRRTTLVGHWPEPLRLARLIARALADAPAGRHRPPKTNP
ncbi:MAG TPA: DUF99 family protein [Thermoplasmata archaeon]|nr:DUF99 family protein [Thermoplasmata archaeon]